MVDLIALQVMFAHILFSCLFSLFDFIIQFLTSCIAEGFSDQDLLHRKPTVTKGLACSTSRKVRKKFPFSVEMNTLVCSELMTNYHILFNRIPENNFR